MTPAMVLKAPITTQTAPLIKADKDNTVLEKNCRCLKQKKWPDFRFQILVVVVVTNYIFYI